MQKRFNVWLTRRIPQGSEQHINHRNIFIVPTRFGISFVFFILLLFLLGTNYQNNVILLISYLLGSFYIVVLNHSFFNLSGLRFQAINSVQGFVDAQVYFPIVVSSNKTRFNISLSFDQGANVGQIKEQLTVQQTKPTDTTVAQLSVGDSKLKVPYFIAKRGHYALGRVLIRSEFGFGLFKAWTRLDFAQQVTAYPKPVAYAWAETQQDGDAEQNENSVESHQDSFQAGQDEFHQLQHYQLGEPYSRVAWKQVARGQGWMTKQYQKVLSGKLQLDFEHLPAGTLEQRLSWLSYAIKDCSEQHIAFSLKLPNQTIAYDNSPEHTVKCLAALARY